MTEVFYMPPDGTVWQMGKVVSWVMDEGHAFAIIEENNSRRFACIPIRDVLRLKEMTDLRQRCLEIADKVEPKYRGEGKSCTSHSAKRWSAAYSAAEIALTSYVPLTKVEESPMIEPK